MRYLTYTYQQTTDFGVLEGDMIRPLGSAIRAAGDDRIPTLLEFVQQHERFNPEVLLENAPAIPLADVRVESPFPTALRNVICLGKNYAEHVNEVKNLANDQHKIPDVPIYFSKLLTTFSGPDAVIDISRSSSQMVDYEVELALIIGKRGRDIQPEDCWEYIFGYSIGNDFSARDLQSAHNQWFRGKSLDGFCGFGPVIVSRDAFPEPPVLSITSHVNGELRQNGRTDQLIFDIPYILSDFSKGTTLLPGDIILTGTPAGVGAGFEPPRFLRPGDVVRCEIEGIGVLENKFV